MAKLTKAEFKERNTIDNSADALSASETDKKALLDKVYEWQHSEDNHAWDEESLIEDLGMNIQNFLLSGKNKDGALVEVEFLKPLDEDVKSEGVACGYRLRMVGDGFYRILKYRHRTPPQQEEEAPTEAE